LSGAERLYRLENVSKQYEGRVVLNVAGLDIFSGEILALVGPSGAGKSTLLRLLNFLEAASTGRIAFAEYSVNGTPPPLAVRRTVTTVFQRSILLNRTVFDNVAYGLRLRGERDVRAKVAEQLRQVRLEHMARAKANSLSGGEIQRVALARALALRPRVLLLDEPTANLDPANVALIEDIITQTNRRQAMTVILVTHNTFQARRLAHRTAVMLDGRIIEVAPTETLFTAPADPRTGAFIRGEMVY